ncbi:unnamed protein product [Protopolystoma xenopodis]|uniref:Uncharacterized protein n=1 Tax=Protopolystoma xenopodis TaxID=117903 RepID=A0A448WHV8_9PLAT|nr:unnamed protein product [Protopolystoma xenopodis]
MGGRAGGWLLVGVEGRAVLGQLGYCFLSLSLSRSLVLSFSPANADTLSCCLRLILLIRGQPLRHDIRCAGESVLLPSCLSLSSSRSVCFCCSLSCMFTCDPPMHARVFCVCLPVSVCWVSAEASARHFVCLLRIDFSKAVPILLAHESPRPPPLFQLVLSLPVSSAASPSPSPSPLVLTPRLHLFSACPLTSPCLHAYNRTGAQTYRPVCVALPHLHACQSARPVPKAALLILLAQSAVTSGPRLWRPTDQLNDDRRDARGSASSTLRKVVFPRVLLSPPQPPQLLLSLLLRCPFKAQSTCPRVSACPRVRLSACLCARRLWALVDWQLLRFLAPFRGPLVASSPAGV